MAQRRTTRLTDGLVLLTGLVGLASVALTVAAWGSLKASDAYPELWSGVAGVVYAVLGALIIRRVGNRVGWMLLGLGVAIAAQTLTSAYAVFGVLAHPGAVPAAKAAGTLSEWLFVPLVMGIAYTLLVFPTGRLPSPRWRPVSVLAIIATAVALVGFILTPRVVALPAPGGTSLKYRNPLGVRALGHTISTLLIGTLPSLTVVSILLLGAAVTALVVRYRSGGPDLRQQIKWVALASGAGVALETALVLVQDACGCDQSALLLVIGLSSAVVALFGIPVALTVAILKYGLYEIDVIINRAVVYGLLAAALTVVYVGIVVGIGTLAGFGGGPVLTTAAAVAIALLFQPLRRRAQRVANRLVYGDRATPYQVLSDFADDMAGTLGLDEMLDRMISVLAAGTGATRVDVWIRVGSELRPAARWPATATDPDPIPLGPGDELPAFTGETRTVAVTQGDELLGALAVEKPRNEPLSGAEDKLLQHLASQAGLVLRNTRLTTQLRANIDELRASRRRLVQAQDEARRRIERNLHDGAQQQLVALRVQLGLLDRFADDQARVRAMAAGLQDALGAALDDLRDLARGIYPPLLADRGLAAALEGQARKMIVPTSVAADGVGRYPQDIEAAVYFCALEALQNVAKYAEAGSVTVRLAEQDGSLVFDIEDDGRGFDATETRYGTGLQGMADRLEAVGGTLDVRSTPGKGTRVQGRVSVPAAGP